jgi:hypothetical protein
VPPGLLLDVDPDETHRELLVQPRVRSEGQVGVAATEVDHPQRILRCGRAQLSGRGRVLDGNCERSQELLDLAVLRLARRLHPTVRVGDAEGSQHRMVLGQQSLLRVVVRPLRRHRLGALAGVQERLALLGDP